MGRLAGTGINESNTRLSASLSRYAMNGKVADNIFKRQPLIEWLKDRKKTYDGGTEIKVKFRYGKGAKTGSPGGIKAFQYYDELNTSPTDTIKSGRATWKNLAGPVVISHEELRENSGQKQFDILKDKVSEAESLMSEEQNDDAWGVSGAAADLVIEPITSIVSGSDPGTIHGLSKSSNTWLNSQELTLVGDLATNLVDKMRSGRNLCVDNAPSKQDKLDLWITDRVVYEGFEDIMSPFLMYNKTEQVDVGFEQLIYTGVPVRFDSSCPTAADGSHFMYGLMSKYWELAIDSEWSFKPEGDFVSLMPKQAVSATQIMGRWALINTNPRTNVRLSGITV